MLLQKLKPDLVRLPVYWDSVEAQQGVFDFTETDQMVSVVDAYNKTKSGRPVKVILIAGLRNMGYPEVFEPAWVPAAEAASQTAVDPESSGISRSQLSTIRWPAAAQLADRERAA